jgi:hypothetical protein
LAVPYGIPIKEGIERCRPGVGLADCYGGSQKPGRWKIRATLHGVAEPDALGHVVATMWQQSSIIEVLVLASRAGH